MPVAMTVTAIARPNNIDSIKEWCKESFARDISAQVVLELIKYIEYLEGVKAEYDRDNGLDNT